MIYRLLISLFSALLCGSLIAATQPNFVLIFTDDQGYGDLGSTNAAIVLPQNGGRYLFNLTNLGNKISMTSIINLSKTVYSPAEYPALREIFSRIVQLQQSQVVFKKR